MKRFDAGFLWGLVFGGFGISVLFRFFPVFTWNAVKVIWMIFAIACLLANFVEDKEQKT